MCRDTDEKNGAVVRRFVGYQRHSGLAAGQCLARLYQDVRLFVNYFQPSMKLRAKTRVGAKVKKTYHKPATPCERLLGHAAVAEPTKETLRSEQGRLDPLALLHRIRDAQTALTVLSGPFHKGCQGCAGSFRVCFCWAWARNFSCVSILAIKATNLARLHFQAKGLGLRFDRSSSKASRSRSASRSAKSLGVSTFRCLSRSRSPPG